MQRVCEGLGQSRWGYEKGGPFLLNDCQDWRPLDRQKYQQLEQNAKKKWSKLTLAWTVWAFYKCVPCCLYIISRHTNDHPFSQLRNIHWCTNRTCVYISASEYLNAHNCTIICPIKVNSILQLIVYTTSIHTTITSLLPYRWNLLSELVDQCQWA